MARRGRVPGITAGPKVYAENIDRLTERRAEAVANGEHLWCYTSLWESRDPTQREGVHLDTENLLSVDGPGCFICEALFHPSMLGRPCPGEPDENEDIYVHGSVA